MPTISHKEKLDEKSGAVEQLEYLFTECNKTEQKIYLFIDEYDHFTNAILSDAESLHRYTEETHKEGYLRAFFNKVKAGTDSCIKRCFITGVSPVTMDDLTSGFNIGTNYSLSPEFNEMTGFTEKEVREMLTYYSTNSPFNHTVGQLLRTGMLRRNYPVQFQHGSLFCQKLYSARQSATENDRKQHTHRLRKTPDADSQGQGVCS